MSRQLTAPTVNLNGTSQAALLEQYTTAGEALRVALNALGEAAPHGRDYQTAPPGAYEAARLQHMRRERALLEVMTELTALADAVDARRNTVEVPE